MGLKKIAGILLCSALFVMSFSVSSVKVQAYTAHTADEAIAWAESKVGTAIDYDGAYGAQCVDLAKAYYHYLGVTPSLGNGADYRTNTLPAGWQRIRDAQPEKGDLLIYTGGSRGLGHVGDLRLGYIRVPSASAKEQPGGACDGFLLQSV